MSIAEQTSIICIVRNRNHQLKRVLNNWLAFPVREVVIVDWRDDGCESAWDIIEQYNDPRIKLIETKYEYRFTKASALNLGITHGVTSPYFLLLDVDYIISEHFFQFNSPEHWQYITGGSVGTSHYQNRYCMCGLTYTTKQAFYKVGGFNENFIYYSQEDDDFCDRLNQAGLEQRPVRMQDVYHLPHEIHRSIESQVHLGGSNITSHNLGFKWFNEYIEKHLMWSDKAPRTQWNITPISDQRYLAIRHKTNKRYLIFILGNQRSMSTLTMKYLNAHGIYTKYSSEHDTILDKQFELTAMLQLDKTVYQHIFNHHEDCGKHSDRGWQLETKTLNGYPRGYEYQEEWIEQGIQIINSMDQPINALKHPASTLCWDFWQQVIARIDNKPHFILCHMIRNPYEIAKSYFVRDCSDSKTHPWVVYPIIRSYYRCQLDIINTFKNDSNYTILPIRVTNDYYQMDLRRLLNTVNLELDFQIFKDQLQKKSTMYTNFRESDIVFDLYEQLLIQAGNL